MKFRKKILGMGGGGWGGWVRGGGGWGVGSEGDRVGAEVRVDVDTEK